MTTIREGARVAYVGESPTLAVGDEGRVIAASGGASHVRWVTGARSGQIDLVVNDDLVENRRAGSLVESIDDSLMVRSLVHTAVRDTYDLEGPSGLLAALSEEGHLAAMGDLGEEALAAVASRLRQDPTVIEVLADLDPDEQEAFVSYAASTILRDATGGGD